MFFMSYVFRFDVDLFPGMQPRNMQYLRRMAGLALIIVAMPFVILGMLPVAIFFVLPLSILLWLFTFISEKWFAWRMICKRRFVPWYALRSLERGDRLILEAPTIGWRTTRLWFVPFQLFDQCPFKEPQSEDEYEEFENGIDPFPVHPFS